MKKGKILNFFLVIAAIAILAVLAFSVRIRPTADNVAVLRTSGMTCGGCGSKVEKALQAKAGVASVEVDVDGGRVVVGYDSKKIGPELLASTVAGAGYRSRVAELLSVEQFRAITGREPGGKYKSAGCGCCNKNGK
jgi:periplasmic mercuric ion binding protein